MAEQLASLRQKGGALSETVLWTNTTPTSAQGETTTNLSEAFTSFDRLRIYFKAIRTGNDEKSVDVPVDLVSTSISASNVPIVCVGANDSGYISYIRRIYYTNDTTLQIRACLRINANGTNNDLAIITRICGLK